MCDIGFGAYVRGRTLNDGTWPPPEVTLARPVALTA